MRVPSVEHEMCFCCAVHAEWRFLIVILWSVVLLFKPRWKCFAFLLVRQTVSSLVWPTLNEKSQQMHFLDPLRIHMEKLKNSNSSVFVLLLPSQVSHIAFRCLNVGWSGHACYNKTPLFAGLRPGHDGAVLWRTGRPHIPRALLLRHCSHVQLHRLQCASHLAGQEVRHPPAPQRTTT